jgi:hypothetical protein
MPQTFTAGLVEQACRPSRAVALTTNLKSNTRTRGICIKGCAVLGIITRIVSTIQDADNRNRSRVCP